MPAYPNAHQHVIMQLIDAFNILTNEMSVVSDSLPETPIENTVSVLYTPLMQAVMSVLTVDKIDQLYSTAQKVANIYRVNKENGNEVEHSLSHAGTDTIIKNLIEVMNRLDRAKGWLETCGDAPKSQHRTAFRVYNEYYDCLTVLVRCGDKFDQFVVFPESPIDYWGTLYNLIPNTVPDEIALAVIYPPTYDL